MESIVSTFKSNSTLIFAFLWVTAEMLALIPSIKANSVFTLIFSFLKSKQPPSA